MQTKRGSRVATSLLLFCSSMMRRHRSRHVLRRLTSAQLVLSTTAIRSPLPPRAPRIIVTDSALDGSGGLSGWLALPADCLPVASQAVRGALLGCVAYSRVCCTGRTTPTGDELAVAPRAEDQNDKPGRYARDMREASNWRAHGFQGIITKRGRASYARRDRVPGMLGITGKTSAR